MAHTLPIREHVRRVSAAAAPEVLSFAPLERGWAYHITRTGVENETSIGTGDIRLAVSGHGYNHFLRQWTAPAPDILYTDDQEILLYEGDSLDARFTGTTSGDVLQLYIEGWRERISVGD